MDNVYNRPCSKVADELNAQLNSILAADPRSPDFRHADGMTNRDIWAMADDHEDANEYSLE